MSEGSNRPNKGKRKKKITKKIVNKEVIRLFVDNFYARYGNMMSKLASE